MFGLRDHDFCHEPILRCLVVINSLTSTMTLTIKLQVEMVEMVQVLDGKKTLAQFDYELLFRRSI
jgi:hypothetical protein